MKQKIEFMHFRPVDDFAMFNGATVAIMPVPDTGKAMVSLSMCGPDDNFNRKLGRTVAEGRLAAYLGGREKAGRHIREVEVSDFENLKAEVALSLSDDLVTAGLA